VFHPGVSETVAAAVRKSVEDVRRAIVETGEIPAQPV
jgi:hypothetical protein